MTDASRPRARSARDGYSLLEVLVGVTILAALGLGSISGLLQSRRLTEGSIRLNTATTVAQGYLEQIKNMEFELLSSTSLPTVMNQGEADPILVSPAVSDPEIGNPASDIVNRKRLDIQNTPDLENDDLELSVVVYVEDISNPGSGIGISRRICLRYSYLISTAGATRVDTNTLYAIRSKVPTY